VLATPANHQAGGRTRLARRWRRPRRLGIETGTSAGAGLSFEVLLDPLVQRVEIGDRLCGGGAARRLVDRCLDVN